MSSMRYAGPSTTVLGLWTIEDTIIATPERLIKAEIHNVHPMRFSSRYRGACLWTLWRLEKREERKHATPVQELTIRLWGTSLGAAGRVDLAMVSQWGNDRY